MALIQYLFIAKIDLTVYFVFFNKPISLAEHNDGDKEFSLSKLRTLKKLDQECFTVKKQTSRYDCKYYTAYDDEDYSINRQRFSLAHEIKHIIYDECDFDEFQERYAEHFARALLLHPAIVICLKNLDVNLISKQFGISKPSVEFAIKGIQRRKEYYGNKLFDNEKEFISKFVDKSLFDPDILKENGIN